MEFQNRNFCRLFFIFIVLILPFFGGCAHYQWGLPVKKASFKTVYIAPVKNRAFVAQVQSVLTRQVLEEILRNGYLRLADKKSADVYLEVSVESYGRSIGAVFETDPDTAKSLSLSLSAKCSLIGRKTEKIYFKEQSVSHSQSINASDFAQPIEYQKMPEITREVAKKIVMLVANVEE